LEARHIEPDWLPIHKIDGDGLHPNDKGYELMPPPLAEAAIARALQ
jgi:lysophospholipase L1-like esterase